MTSFSCDNCLNIFDLQTNFIERGNDPFIHNDPDNQFLNEILSNSSDYFTADSFSSKCKKYSTNKNDFSLIHLNIRSIPKNMDQFLMFLETVNCEFSIIGFTETWLKEENVDCYGISGYNCEHNYRKDKIGGGVSLFIKNEMEYNCRKDLTLLNSHIESLFVEIPKCENLKRNILIGVIYRPPKSFINLFNEYMNTILETIKSENALPYIIGDFNINLLNQKDNSLTSDFLNMMYSFSFVPVINKPTRITNSSSSLIDNIFRTCSNVNVMQGLFETDISDHLPIFLIIKEHVINKETNFVTTRDYSASNILQFTEKHKNTRWDDVLNCKEPEMAYKVFYKILYKEYDQYFPVKTFEIKYKNRKPWLTDGLKISIKKKNKLYILQKKKPHLCYKEKYKSYRNMLHRLLANLISHQFLT